MKTKDLRLTNKNPGRLRLFRNEGRAFREVTEEVLESGTLAQLAVLDACFFDFDNNGFLDLMLIGKSEDHEGAWLYLLRNEGQGQFSDVSAILPSELREAQTLVIGDMDNDDDLDLIVGTPAGRIRLLRNDGGNLNRLAETAKQAMFVLSLTELDTASGEKGHRGQIEFYEKEH